MNTFDRRQFLKDSAGVMAGLGVTGLAVSGCRGAGDGTGSGAGNAGGAATGSGAASDAAAGSGTGAGDDSLFKISLAEWSLHRTLNAGDLDHLDFIGVTKNEFGIDAVEYVNSFFFERARDTAYLTEMNTRADGEGVRNLLIMCDNEGRLGDPDEVARATAIENHYKWVEAAKFLGCHSIRVNAASEGSWEEQQQLAADGLRRLSEFGAEHDINVIVENHGGLSSNGQWLSGVIQAVDHPHCGTLPDFGNFRISDDEMYDFYDGVTELMPYAKAVSAKSHDFGEDGNETELDYLRLMRIVLDAGYRGYVGIEYEGNILPEREGTQATKDLLVRVRDELAGQYGTP
jgi:L-ribulose-5-phosphate 3-epimerase